MAWQAVCVVDDLQGNSGVCVLVAGHQVALFYVPKQHKVYALHNYDPIGKANVLSRGIVGNVNNQIVVASPLYKQHFNLVTGQCLEDSNVQVAAYAARIVDDWVEVNLGGCS